MAKKKLTLFQKRLLKVIGLTSLAIVLLMGFFIYFRNDILKRNSKVENYKREIVDRQLIMSRIQTLEKEIKEAEPYLSRLKQSLPSETETVNLESNLKSLAEKYNLDFSFRFGTLNQETESEPKSYNFSLTVSGRIDNLTKWLEEVNKSFFSLRLEKIELNQTSPASSVKIKRGGVLVTQNIPASYEVKIVGRIYLR